MFESIVDEHERGQVGIGTLIVFIAMVLVAAIAAGVLINTAGVLQTQASDTGSETQEAVANQIEVTHAAGHVNGDVIDQVDMTLMKSAGSNAIDLEAMTVQYTSSSTDATLTHEDDTSNADHFDTEELAGENDGTSLTSTDDRVKLILDTASLEASASESYSPTVTFSGTNAVSVSDFPSEVSSNDVITFTVEHSMGTDSPDSFTIENIDGSFSETISSLGDGSSEDIELDVSSTDIEDGDTLQFSADSASASTTEDISISESGLSSGSSATVKLVDQSGAQFTYGISVPSTFGNKKVVSV